MRTALILICVAGAAQAQFGGIFDKYKRKVDRTVEKTRPVSERAVRAVETFTPWTSAEEQEIGEASAARMVAMFGLVEEPDLVRYVNLVGSTVARRASRQVPWRFAVLDTDIVGAFAIPGGFVFLTRGALAGMTNEAQLAGALGHEIVHIAERHLESAIRSKRTSNWAVEEGKAQAVGNAFDLRDKTDALLRDLFNMSLSRDAENQADDGGTRLAAQAGYDAGGLLSFLRAMAEAQSKPENQRLFGQLLSTHPAFESRIEHLTPLVARNVIAGKTLDDRFQRYLPR